MKISESIGVEGLYSLREIFFGDTKTAWTWVLSLFDERFFELWWHDSRKHYLLCVSEYKCSIDQFYLSKLNSFFFELKAD